MAIMWSLIWAISVFCVMFFTIRYYLPKLYERAIISMSENLENADKDNAEVKALSVRYNSFILNNRNLKIVLVLACTCFAGVCGYSASVHSVSIFSMIKMTIMMCVLSCIFITDIEFMLIPNSCSMCALVSRIIIAFLEFIWMRDEALVWLLNSICAMIISLMLLIIVSLLTRGGLGMGDVKIFSSLGFMCGISAVYFSVFFAFIFCAIASTIFLALKKKNLKDSLPLGPFIWLGYGVTVLLAII